MQFLGVPLAHLCNEAFGEPRERILMKNIAYAGVLVALLDIDMKIIEGLLEEKYGRKKALMESNHKAIRLGYDYAIDNLSCPLPIRLQKMNALADKILIDGNTATALGCLYAGATVAAWYPITPGHLGDGRLQGPLRQVPQGPRDRQEELLHPAGRGRAGRHRHGDRRRLERGPRLHLDRGPRHLADERAHRAWPTTPRSRR